MITTTNLSWKQSILNHFTIFDGLTQIGSLKPENLLENSSIGAIGNQKYIFKKKNIWENKTSIIDETSRAEIGLITYTVLGNQGTITINGQNYKWKFSSMLNDKWYIEDVDGKNRMDFRTNFYKGNIKGADYDPLKILIGLFIYDRLQRNNLLIYMIIFLPLMFSWFAH